MKRIFVKVIVLITTVIIVSFFTFVAFSVLPGNPIEIMLGTDADPLQVEKLTKEMGLDKPLINRYTDWLTGVFKGDLGTSIKYNVPVTDLLSQRIPVTLSLAIVSLSLTLIITKPVSIFLALYNDKKFTIIFSAISQLGVSIPTFWLGILLILVFSINFNMFPSGGYVSLDNGFEPWFKSVFLPSLSIAVGASAVLIRYFRASLLDQMNLDYIRTAKSKGLTEKVIIYKHVLRNALLPTITIFALIVVDVLGGSVIIENVFNMAGVGKLLTTGVFNRDFPLVQSIIFLITLLVLATNLIVDIIYTIIDPRLKNSKR